MSSTKKDMRRVDLIVPYQKPNAKEAAGDLSATMGSTLPMAAMFTRNKYIGWAAVVYSIQSWLSESPESRQTASQPAYLSVGMSVLSILVAYLPLFMPPVIPAGRAASGTEAPAAAPLV